ncbi:terminase large subunit [Sedimenticola selenatireducens]|uniref:Terminase large subunit n=1 Tax=Sedimenticola selenatireducens TaxID=191960 RepID=A0A557SCI4_9GAMM|nr:terminase TerL endonuclease subunit [Sedimenticola selenatireducens]TVO75129.1 terminase large subunit [Sedimenticola selenatireducens]TVT67016.1 MAG: terminase large subunit [Sedimenticola selenatireducens]
MKTAQAQKKRPDPKSISDEATEYAHAVVSGKTIAGPHVRDACQRHLNDLEIGHERGLVWSIDHVNWAIGYFRDVLCLNGGEYEGVPFEPLGWQLFIIGSLFGWLGDDGFRRFRVAYVETAKGSGKSPLAAGVGLYGLTADQESRAEIYAAATKKDQAMVLFRDAVAMVDLSPELTCRIHKSGSPGKEWNLAYHSSDSFFRPISADDGQSGPRPHIGLIDEIHEHRSPVVVEMLRAGTKSRRQALMFMITNSGTDKQSVCWDYHDYGAKIAAGTIQDDSFFSFVCSLDEHDDPFKDETCWIKANPSIDAGIPGLKYLREQVVQARGMPSKESIVRRLNFCQWVDAASPWISSDVWFAAQDTDFDPIELQGRRCWGGLDLGSTQDLTAFVLLFEPTETDQHWRLLPRFWVPGDQLTEKERLDRVPYLSWRDAGHLVALPGKAINKLAVIKQVAEDVSRYAIQSIAYDRWRIEDLKMLMEQEGIELPLQPFGQGFKDMSPSLDEFEQRLLNDSLKHSANPVMTWCAANAVIASDPSGNRKIDKKRATGRVDGIVAAIMAAGQSSKEAEQQPTPELIIL